MVFELLRQRASIREVRGPGGRGSSSFLPGSGCRCGYENPEVNTVTCGFLVTVAFVAVAGGNFGRAFCARLECR
jgi:hypothetical protein